MPTSKSPAKKAATKKAPNERKAAKEASVEELLAALAHPRKREIEAVRKLILDADPSIKEGVKWNAPSFKTSEYFATIHLRSTDCVQVILHLGAKKRAAAKMSIPDPEGLLEWLGNDRATVKLRDAKDLEAKHDALVGVVRAWLTYV